MIIVHATLSIRPDVREAFLGAVGGLVAASNAEPGVISYACHERVAEPNTFVFVERYEDKAAFDAHLTSPHFQGAAGALPNWVSSAPEILWYEADSENVLPLG